MNSFNKFFLSFIALTFIISCTSQKSILLNYIDPNIPSLTTKIFAPDFISKEHESEFGSIFSEKGTEFYYAIDINGKAEIRYTRLKNNRWSIPKTIISHEKYGYNDPFLSTNEKELFYISNMPKNEKDTIPDYDIWYSKKINNEWSKPINAGNKINSDNNEYYISFASNGTMYFASNKNAEKNRLHDYDIYSATRINNEFNEPEKLNNAINSKRYEADVFVSPNESYLIFSSARKEGFGKGDLYISFKNKNGEWQNAKNMGAIVNTKNHELCPFVTKDGKYLLYTSNQDIYWISTQILNQFK